MKKRPLLEVLRELEPGSDRELLLARILCGEVRVDGARVRDPRFPADAVQVSLERRRFASRGGLKLDGALAPAHGPSVEGLCLLDAGCSTGGFTDCLLERGAARVIAVDVGYGQLDYRLRRDPRVALLERTNILSLTPDKLPGLPDGAGGDHARRHRHAEDGRVMNPFATLLRLIDRDGAGALVTIVRARGSTPREAGARIVASQDGAISGTIGGGRLEAEAIDAAVRLMGRGGDTAETLALALGPALGQCCGGHVTLLVEAVTSARREEVAELAAAVAEGPVRIEAELSDGQAPHRRIVGRGDGEPTAGIDASGHLIEIVGRRLRSVYLFGAGHVGRSLVLALAPLPFTVKWVDERADMFPKAMPANVTPIASAAPERLAAGMPHGAFAIIMTHDHAADLRILHAVLLGGEAAYVGLIGSATKREHFERRLQQLGLDRKSAAAFRCPIGISGIKSKDPAVIAAAVAAELLVFHERLDPPERVSFLARQKAGKRRQHA